MDTAIEQIIEWAEEALNGRRLRDSKPYTIQDYRSFIRLILAEAKDENRQKKGMKKD